MAHALRPHRLDFELLHLSIHQVSASRPWVWLQRGWADTKENFGTSIVYGLFVALAGALLLMLAANQPYLFTAAVSGFMLVGPLAAAGLYEISRRSEQGRRATSLGESLAGLSRNRTSLLQFGVMLVLAVIAWERLSAILFALFYTNQPVSAVHYLRDVFLSGEHWPFVIAYAGVGAVLAAVLYALSAVAVPMLVDREVDIITAIIASAHAVTHNLGAMLLWAAILVGLMAIGFATLMIGMLVVFPLAGHATWHAYRDLVGDAA